jgi:hypothetical protein
VGTKGVDERARVREQQKAREERSFDSFLQQRFVGVGGGNNLQREDAPEDE